MTNVDLTTLGAMMGGGGQSGNLETTFGVPDDMFDMTANDLAGLPSAILEEFMALLAEFARKTDEREKDIIKKYMLETGILEYDTQEGTYQFLTDNSMYGLDRNEGQIIHNLRALAGV